MKASVPRADAANAPRRRARSRFASALRRAAIPGEPMRWTSELLELFGDLAHRRLGVAEQHRGLLVVEERVVDACEAGVHGALEHDHRPGFVDVEDRHPVD